MKLFLHAVIFTVVCLISSAQAANFSVTNTANAGADTLRQAIIDANASGTNDTITISLPADSIITLASNLPAIDKSGLTLDIDANSVSGLIINGASAYRVFFVQAGTVSISNMTIANGLAQGGSGGSGNGGGGGGLGAGGALFINGGDVTLNDVLFSSNSAIGGTGGIGLSSDLRGGGGGGGLDAPGADASFGVANAFGGVGGGPNGGTAGTPNITPSDGGPGGDLSGGGGGGGLSFSGTLEEGGVGGAGGFGGGAGGRGETECGIFPTCAKVPNSGGYGGGGGGEVSTLLVPGFNGFGGGTGGVASFADFGAAAAAGGGGGAGLGGAIFMRDGANLTLNYTSGPATLIAASANAVTGGTAGATMGSANFAATNGQAYGAFSFFGGNNTQTISVASGLTRTISDSMADRSIAVAGPSTALNKTGDGTLVLSGSSVFGGTIISAGVLQVDGSLVGGVTINTGGVLSGDGTVGAVNVNSGGSIAPGASAGSMSCGHLNLFGGSSYSVEIEGTTAGTEYDQLTVGGFVGIDSTSTLSLSGAYVPNAGETFTIIDNDLTDAVVGNFNGLAEGAIFLFNGAPFSISYLGGDGNDVVLTALLDTDGDGDPDITDPDDDNDGVDDVTEQSDGTNPLDSGSAIEHFGDQVCVEWNGFVDFLTQILELRNTSGSTVTLDVTLFDILGAAQDVINLSLAPGIQQDVIINDLNGFIANTFGLVCAKITSGPIDSLGGQLVTYRLTETSYTLAYSSEFLPARSGRQYLTYNTYQPSLNPGDAANFVANWVQLVSDETTNQSGTLRYFDFEGNEVRTEVASFGPGERLDIDAHTLGTSLTGLICWEPDNPTAKFRVRQNRYYYGPTGLSDLAAAISLPAKRGTGEKLTTAFDTRGRTVAVEISNTTDSAILVTTTVRDEMGSLATSQPPVLNIPANGTRGLVINHYLASALGNLQIDSDTLSSMVVSMIEYGRGVNGSLLYANPSSPLEALAIDTRGTYNSFLGQACRIRVASCTASAETAEVSMTRYDGTVLLNKQSINVPASGALELDLCSNETQAAYGETLLEAATNGVLVSEVIRQNVEGTIEFGAALKP